LERGENKQDKKETEADNKTMGVDGIPNEMWRKNRGMGVRIMQQSMEGEGMTGGVERGCSRAN